MNPDETFMTEARREAALAAEAGEIPVGAVAVVDGVIIGRSHNSVERDCNAASHAEMNLLRELSILRGDWRMEDVTIYVTKEPCPMCSGAMINSRVAKVVYGMPDPRSGGEALNIFNHPGVLWQVKVVGGVLAEECLADFQGFFRRVRNGQSPKPNADKV